jgi:hypothetical protein
MPCKHDDAEYRLASGRRLREIPMQRPASSLFRVRFVAFLAIAVIAVVALTACGPLRPVQKPSGSRVLFGMGPEATSDNRLVREAPVRMLTCWYNGPGDLDWMSGWKDDVVPNAYAAGRPMHLVVWTGDAERTVSTKYGTGCGRAYPLSDRFLGDMARLADTFRGGANGPPLYVTLFTEFQTYPCADNAWNPNAQTNAYLRALKDRYTQAMSIFHQHAPNARVSLGWGGWQSGWTDEQTGAGRAMIPHFADVMRASDFQSFQVMGSANARSDARAMTDLLSPYGAVMLAHYEPANGSSLESDMRAFFTDASVRDLVDRGLFAFSFMNDKGMDSGSAYQAAKTAVQTYAVR